MSSIPVPVVELPCVVQLGFSGSRHPFPDRPDREDLLDQLTGLLAHRLRPLRDDLKLHSGHFFCGISQVAVGCDFAFSKACRAAEIPQRFFLPQNREDFLKAVDPRGNPDFDPAQRAEALALLTSPHAIQVRVVSDSPDRTERFRDAAMELLRVSDLIICVLPATTPAGHTQKGGTADVLHYALERDKPVLEWRVKAEGDRVIVEETKHNFDRFITDPPRLPEELAGLTFPADPLPGDREFLKAIRTFTSEKARRLKMAFVSMALLIIAFHLLATLFATVAVTSSHHHGPGAANADFQKHLPTLHIILLVLEFSCLFIGISFHRWVHHSVPARVWAMSRLLSLISESVIVIGNYPLYLRHLLLMPFPHRLRALLRTINVLHLHAAKATDATDWKPVRDRYVADRLLDNKRGQIPFYAGEVIRLRKWNGLTRLYFSIFAYAAVGMTLLKLTATLLSSLCDCGELDQFLPYLGGLAIILPVSAVAAISWGLALSYEARLHTYRETYEFLTGESTVESNTHPGDSRARGHLHRLQKAQTKAEFEALLVETEARLLGENLNWYYRQSFAEVA